MKTLKMINVEETFSQVGCVIMASGMGKRFGGNKLMADFCGEPMILQALKATEGLSKHRVVVTRHEEIAKLCKERGICSVYHQLPHRSDTVRFGIEVVGNVEGCLFVPGDQPLLRRETVDQMVLQWSKEKEMILRPCCGETCGAPILFPKWSFAELKSLPEGKGGGVVVKNHPEKVSYFAVKDPYELMDVDTKETLAVLQQVKDRK